MTRGGWVGRGVLAGGLVLVLSACTGDDGVDYDPPTPMYTTVLDLDFDGAVDTGAGVLDATSLTPGIGLDVSTAALPGGSVSTAEGRSGSGLAVEVGSDGVASALDVGVEGREDTLAPGREAFRFGADFRLTVPPEPEAGHNIVQRGLFNDVGQYKLQVDGGHPSCRVSGMAGDVIVKGDVTVKADTWYRIACERDEDTVVLSLSTWDEQGDLQTRTWAEDKPSGDIGEGDPPAPLSIGAKLNSQGGVVTDSPDLFQGEIDNVFVDVQGP